MAGGRKHISKTVRFSVFARDNFTCVYCGRQPPSVVLELEHFIPVCQGGTNEETNLKTSCADCNDGKGKKTIKQSAPTEIDQLKIAQELAEKRARLNEIASFSRVADELRQEVVDKWCEVLQVESCNRQSVSIIMNLIQEFSVPCVMEWMHIAAERTYFRETKAIKYLCGIARKTRVEEQE